MKIVAAMLAGIEGPLTPRGVEDGKYIRQFALLYPDGLEWRGDGVPTYSDGIDLEPLAKHLRLSGGAISPCGEQFNIYNRAGAMSSGMHETWWENGLRHRAGDLPAVTRRLGGRSRTLSYYRNGLCYRAGGRPDVIEYMEEEGVVRLWTHRLGGPPDIRVVRWEDAAAEEEPRG